MCDIVPADHLQVIEGLSRLCLAGDFLQHNNSHPKPLCVRLCFKVRLLIPCVITDHNGKHNDLSPFDLLFFKHCLHFLQQRKERKLLFWYYDSWLSQTRNYLSESWHLQRAQTPGKDSLISKLTFFCVKCSVTASDCDLALQVRGPKTTSNTQHLFFSSRKTKITTSRV